ncbi:MAG: DUF692 family multinuclear iron-containing protein [Pseudomonadota bacterium]
MPLLPSFLEIAMKHMTKTLPNLGFGLGLRASHYPYIFEHLPPVDWFEIISENFMDTDGRPKRNLARIAEHYPIVMHGISLAIGNSQPLNREYLEKLKNLIDWIKPVWISDHLCWTGNAHQNSHDLLPVPYTEEALKHITARIRQVQDILERPIALENPSTYLEFKSSSMPEAEFMARMVEESGCNILLDVNNVYVTCYNHRLDPQLYIDILPLERVTQIHLSGHSNYGTHIIDTHDDHVVDEVWALYHYVLQKAERTPNTMVEWDGNIPDFPVLFAELNKAKALAAATHEVLQLPQLASPSHHELNSVPLEIEQERLQNSILLGDMYPIKPEEWIHSKQEFAPAEQLGVYINAYHARLYEVVEVDYPVLKQYLGDEAFDALITSFINTVRSDHFNIGRFAAKLPNFLASYSSSDKFAYELCVLETQLSQLADAAETVALTAEHLAGFTSETLMDSILYPRQALQLFAFDYDVNHYYCAIQEETHTPEVFEKKSYLAIFRHEDIMWRMDLEKHEYQLLQMLFSGKTIGAALELLQTESEHDKPENNEEADSEAFGEVYEWFGRWIRNGLLAYHAEKNQVIKETMAA